jgi:hypothetical protein
MTSPDTIQAVTLAPSVAASVTWLTFYDPITIEVNGPPAWVVTDGSTAVVSSGIELSQGTAVVPNNQVLGNWSFDGPASTYGTHVSIMSTGTPTVTISVSTD